MVKEPNETTGVAADLIIGRRLGNFTQIFFADLVASTFQKFHRNKKAGYYDIRTGSDVGVSVLVG